MRAIIIMMLMGFGFELFAEDKKVDSWFCRDESGKRSGDTMWACGVGEAPAEGAARSIALHEAFKEYHMICDESADCDAKKAIVEPKRLTCVETFEGRLWKCYRLIEIHLFKEKSP